MSDREPPDVPEPDLSHGFSWEGDDSSEREAKEWTKLDQVRERNDTLWLQVYGLLLVSVTVVLSALFIASLVAWAWHYLAPSCWGWLTENQLGKVQSILFSGGMGAIVSAIAKKQIDKG